MFKRFGCCGNIPGFSLSSLQVLWHLQICHKWRSIHSSTHDWFLLIRRIFFLKSSYREISRWQLPVWKGFCTVWRWQSEDVLIFGTDSLCDLGRQILSSFTLSLLAADFQTIEISLKWLQKRLEIIWGSWFTICSQAREELPYKKRPYIYSDLWENWNYSFCGF